MRITDRIRARIKHAIPAHYESQADWARDIGIRADHLCRVLAGQRDIRVETLNVYLHPLGLQVEERAVIKPIPLNE